MMTREANHQREELSPLRTRPTEATAPVVELKDVPSDPRERRAMFEAEVLSQLDALFSFALKLSHARDEAEDLVSETVLRALERWEQYRLGTNGRAWLFTILYHVFVSRRRRVTARELPLPE